MEQNSAKKRVRTIEILKGGCKLSPHEAVVSTETLIQLDILNHTWLYATHKLDSVPWHSHAKTQQFRPIMMLCFVEAEDSFKCRKGIAMVSLEAAFNIIFPDIDAFNRFQEGKRITIHLNLMENLIYEPPVADRIKISAIRSPMLSRISSDYDVSLKNHFKLRRFLVLNQVFSVPYEEISKTENNSADMPYLWFKVVDLQDTKGIISMAWVAADSTRMSECVSEHAFLPYTENYIADQKLIVGLQEQFKVVRNLSVPIIKTSTDYSHISLLLHGPPASGKRFLALSICKYLCLHFYEVNCFDLIGESLAAVEQRIKNLFDKARYFSPCLFLLRNIHAFCNRQNDDGDEPRIIRYLSNCIGEFYHRDRVLIMASTNCFNKIGAAITRLFTYQIEIGPPDEEVRSELLKMLLQDEKYDGCNLEVVSKQTAGMVLGDFPTLISEALKNAEKRKCCSEPNKERVTIIQQDIENALEKVHAEYREMLGMPDIPKVSWSDVGGLARVKAEIIDTIKLPMQYPELVSNGLQRSGLLLYGPPGCGKTLLAKAVATEFSLNFFSVKGPELMNMYVGQSEQNVRDMFRKARESSPCVIFFDELDSIAPNRGRSGDSGGVMDRIVSQLLAELDGLQTSNSLFVIGATNRPDLLDNALLRPGRFDRMIYVGFPESKADRSNIIKSYTDKMQLSADINLNELENSLPLYLTGADFYALCSDAYLNAIKRSIKEDSLNEREYCVSNQEGIMIRMCDFDAAAEQLVPSVSIDDILKYKDIKNRIDKERTTRK